ncbi:hypothetical protein D3C80_985110 [compost metagenome]
MALNFVASLTWVMNAVLEALFTNLPEPENVRFLMPGSAVFCGVFSGLTQSVMVVSTSFADILKLRVVRPHRLEKTSGVSPSPIWMSSVRPIC